MRVGKWHLKQRYPEEYLEAACGSPKYYHAGITEDITKVDCGMCKRTRYYKDRYENQRRKQAG